MNSDARAPRLVRHFAWWAAGVIVVSSIVVALLLLVAHVVGPRPWTRATPSGPLEPRVRADSDTARLLADVDAYVEREMRDVRAPGAGLVIVSGTAIIHDRGFGRADPSGRPVTPETPFILGSLSKAFTALAIAQLAERGGVQLDTPVQRYLPWFRMRDSVASARMTLRQLLHQTSGIPKGQGMRVVSASRAVTDSENAHLIRRVRLSHAPGERFEYSNANYWLLGLVVEAASRQPYEQYVREHIFTPLGMHHTYTSEEVAAANGLASGYRVWFGFPRAEHLPFYSRELAVGYLISTPDDMGKFLIANLSGGRGIGLSDSAVAQLHDAAPGSPYAMGWLDDFVGDVPVVWHTGAVANYHCDMLLIPQRGIGVALLSNVNNILLEHQYSQAVKGVAALLLGFQPPRHSNIRYRETYWIISIAAVAWLVWRLRQVVHLWRRHRRDRESERQTLNVAESLVDPGLSLGVVFGLRVALQTPFSTLRWYVPDLMILLLANLAASLLLAAWRIFFYERAMLPENQ